MAGSFPLHAWLASCLSSSAAAALSASSSASSVHTGFSLAPDAVSSWRNKTVPLRIHHHRRPVLLKREFIDLLDCSYDPGWTLFRHVLRDAIAQYGSLGAASEADDVKATAEKIARLHAKRPVHEFYRYMGERAGLWHKLLIGEIPFEESYFREEHYCHYGMLTLAHLYPQMLPRLPGGTPFMSVQLGKFGSLDFLTSSSWPIDYLDLLLGVGEAGAKAPRTLQKFLSDRPELEHPPPLLWRAVDPQGATCTTRAAWACSPPAPLQSARGLQPTAPIRLGVSMAHISLTMDITTTLLKANGLVHATMLCGDPREKETRTDIHTGSCSKACKVAPWFCTLPRVHLIYEPGEILHAQRESDILLCFGYVECADLVEAHGKPFILYDGTQYGHLLFGRANPDWSHVAALRTLLAQDVYVTQRRQQNALLPHESLPAELPPRADGQPQPGGVVFTTNPWQAESLFFLTGTRVPSVRPGNLYLTCQHNPVQSRPEVFMHNDRGRCVVCSVFADVLRNVQPEDYPLKIVHTPDYMDFCDIAKFRAMLLIPHGNVMQMFFREAVNMAMPTFVPDRGFLAKQPFLWFFERMETSLGEEHREVLSNPPRPPGFAEPHPSSPYVLKQEDGPDRIAAVIYWMQFLDYFHWPGVRHFSSLPHLLHDLLHANHAAAHRDMRHFVTRQRRLSAVFWRDALLRLLGPTRGLERNASAS